MIIGIDIDGVLFPWEEAARDALVAEFGIEKPAPSTTWSYLKGVLEPGQWGWLWTREGQDATFGQVGRVYPGVTGAVNALLRAGHHVHFVTHRDPRRTAVHTATFLALHFGRHPWGGVHIVHNDVAKRRLARWDVFVDDKPETVWDFLANSNARVFAPVRPWNTELEEDTTDQLTRYVHPDDIVRWVGRYS